jgi:hypothetical protein
MGIPALLVLASVSMACGSPTQPMQSGAGVPASEGTVRATDGDNGSTNVALRVKHLAPPAKVASDATVYVVWVRARNANRQNVGALKLNDDLEGSLDTTTPHRQFELSVTPEPSSRVAQPTHDPVFTSHVNRGK